MPFLYYRREIAIAAIFFVGIMGGLLWGGGWWFRFVFFIFITANIFYFGVTRRWLFGIVVVTLLLFGFARGLSVPAYPSFELVHIVREEGCSIFNGVIVQEWPRKAEKRRLVVEGRCQNKRGAMTGPLTNALVTFSSLSSVGYGDRVRVRGFFYVPRDFYDVEKGQVVAWRRFLSRRGIFLQARAEEYWYEGPDRSFLFKMKRILTNTRASFVRVIEQFIPTPYAALVSGELVGQVVPLGKHLEDILRRAGVIHIVVLSGYNVTIVAEWVRRLAVLLSVRLSFFLSLVGITLFVLLVGAEPPVVRAGIMAAIYIIGRYGGWGYNIVSALIWTAVLMVAVAPQLLTNPSFQLSFSATVGVAIFAPYLEEILQRKIFGKESLQKNGNKKNKHKKHIKIISMFVSLAATTFAAQMFAAPFLLYYFSAMPVFGAMANFLVLPLVPLTMLFGFLTVFTFLFSSAGAQFFATLAYLCVWWQIAWAEFFSSLPYATISVPFWAGRLASLFFAVIVFLLSVICVKRDFFAYQSDLDPEIKK